MRWNGVFILGLGISVIGFMLTAGAYTHSIATDAPERLITLASATLIAGALTTAVGAFRAQRRDFSSPLPSRRSRLFGGATSHSGPRGARFGKRSGEAAPKSKPKTQVQTRPTLLALDRPR